MAWLGPAIGPQAFEVGSEVRERFVAHDAQAASAFAPAANDKWLCDIRQLARRRLHALGIRRITGADSCTLRDAENFFSYRRDGATGRMASLVWLE
jgi:copper oxidase (laccase) domain-containing protein